MWCGMDDILFFRGRWRILSNFYILGFASYGGQEYKTSEHAFQAAKFVEPEIRAEIRKAETPGEAKRIGRHYPISTPDWEDVKIGVMDTVLESKFRSAMNRAKLLATRDAYLEEGNTWGDTFWGVCDGEGRNELGKALMRRRQELGGYGITLSWRDM